MMDPLLDKMLVRRVVRIKYLNSFPAALTARSIRALQRKASQQHSDSQTLRIHTRLHQLLRAGEVPVAGDNAQRDAHGSNPRAKHDTIAVVRSPALDALAEALLGRDLLVEFLVAVAELALGVGGALVGVAGLLGRHDRRERARRHRQERPERQRQPAERREAP